MTKLTNWEVCVEYGPTAADVHYVIVSASSNEDALYKATQWAFVNKIANAMVSNASDLGTTTPEEEDFTDVIEWTEEEEEEFVKMVKGDI